MAAINPWLEEQVRDLHSAHSNDELRTDYEMMYGETGSLSWNDYLMWKAIKDAIDANPFLLVHRTKMDLPQKIKKWLYWNNIDRVLDLIQVSEEELHVMTTNEESYYNLLIEYLSNHGCSLRHNTERTFKISSTSPLLAVNPARLNKWMVNPAGKVHTFNDIRPTLDPEWFDEFYRKYEHSKHEEYRCKKLVPVSIGLNYEGIEEYNEFFSSLRKLWDAYHDVCKKYKITPIHQNYHIPESISAEHVFPFDRFISLNKDVIRAVIDAFEQIIIYCNFTVQEFFIADHHEELEMTDKVDDEIIQNLMIQYVSLDIDYGNIFYYLEMFHKTKIMPCNEWPFNPWLQETILKYRNLYTEEELRSQYKDYLEIERKKTWNEFLTEYALARQINDIPNLLIPLEDMELPKDIKNKLRTIKVEHLADLMQVTELDIDLLFDYDKFKKEDIDNYLKKEGLHLYHSDKLTYKIPVPHNLI